MRGDSGMSEPELSAREQRFEAARRRAGFLLAPVVFLILWFWPIAGLAGPPHRLLAVMGAVVVGLGGWSVWLLVPLGAVAYGATLWAVGGVRLRGGTGPALTV